MKANQQILQSNKFGDEARKQNKQLLIPYPFISAKNKETLSCATGYFSQGDECLLKRQCLKVKVIQMDTQSQSAKWFRCHCRQRKTVFPHIHLIFLMLVFAFSLPLLLVQLGPQNYFCVISASLINGLLTPSSRSLMKMLNKTRPNTNPMVPWQTPLHKT